MSRDIKFRAQDFKGAWHYGYFCKDYEGICYITTLDGVDTTAVKEETLGQYTGLKDKNGVEIFEHDKLKIEVPDEDSAFGSMDDYHGVVVYGRDCKSTNKRYVTEYPSSFIIHCQEWYHEEGLLGNNRHILEVTGNIHENSNSDG